VTLRDFSKDFGPFDGQTWLNCAHQGPLPKVSAEAALEAVKWKQSPFELTTERFSGVPVRLREALGRLVKVSSEDIILGNSASYGMHLLANGLPFEPGDEVLLVKGDFPSVTLPWLGLESKGVTVRFIERKGASATAAEVRSHITPKTKVFCTTWVHSFTGHVLDMDAIGAICRDAGVSFVLNTSQALGARPLDLRSAPVDAITNVGFKWLLGPYGTGFSWIRPELRETLDYNQSYWLSMQTADDLGSEDSEPGIKSGLGARRYDVFGTANFFNFKAWTASIEYLLDIGVEQIAEHDQTLVQQFVDGLDKTKYEFVSPVDSDGRSTLVVFSHVDPAKNEGIYFDMRKTGVYGAYRRGRIRIAPHIHNTLRDVDAALEFLNSV